MVMCGMVWPGICHQFPYVGDGGPHHTIQYHTTQQVYARGEDQFHGGHPPARDTRTPSSSALETRLKWTMIKVWQRWLNYDTIHLTLRILVLVRPS